MKSSNPNSGYLIQRTAIRVQREINIPMYKTAVFTIAVFTIAT